MSNWMWFVGLAVLGIIVVLSLVLNRGKKLDAAMNDLEGAKDLLSETEQGLAAQPSEPLVPASPDIAIAPNSHSTKESTMKVVSDFSSGNMLAEVEAGYEYPAALGAIKQVEEHGLYTFNEANGIAEHDDGNKTFFWVGPVMGIETAVYDPQDNILAITVLGKLYRMNIKQGETFDSLSDFAADGEFVDRG